MEFAKTVSKETQAARARTNPKLLDAPWPNV
jgi:hypothetical protein